LDAYARGGDFPSIWNVILKTHPLVVGIPSSHAAHDGPVLRVPLADGQHLQFDSKGDFTLGQTKREPPSSTQR
jgi:hypothetical protein